MQVRLVCGLLGIALCIGTLIYCCSAEPGSDLILVASLDRQGAYRPGDVATLTVFSYFSGESVELSEIHVNLTDIYGGNLKPLNPVKMEKGKYMVQYNLTSEDEEKRFVVTGILSELRKTIYISLPFESPALLYISFPDANSSSLQPGKNVSFSVECFFNSSLTEPESIAAFLEVNGTQEPLNLSKEGKRYTGNFTVPQLNRSESFKITATARLNGKVETTSVWLSYIPLSVWYRPVRITETSARIELGICDENGRGVGNATIKLSYATDFLGERKKTEARTDNDGIASFYLLPEPIFSSYLYIWGEVSAGESAAEFLFSIKLQGEERPSSGFDVILHNSSYANGTLRVNGTVYSDSKPFSGAEILYFLKNWGQIHGNFTTDKNGAFTLEIGGVEERHIHPYFGVTLVFVAAENSSLQTEEITWLNLPADWWMDPCLSLDYKNFGFGKVLELTLSSKSTFLTHMCSLPFAYIYDGNLNTTGEFWASWYPLLASVYFVPVNKTTMRCTFPIPAFAYSCQKNITIAAIYYEHGTFVPHMAVKKVSLLPEIKMNFSVALTGEDYIVVKWERYEGENFVKYEILAEAGDGWVSVANITERNITSYTITLVNGEPLKGGKEYRLKLRVYFDEAYAEEIVTAFTRPKVPGFTAMELFAVLLGICIGVFAKMRKRCR
ncbi:MAG: hypothetical protein QW531_03150 [Thermoplasmata archaeon]